MIERNRVVFATRQLLLRVSLGCSVGNARQKAPHRVSTGAVSGCVGFSDVHQIQTGRRVIFFKRLGPLQL